MKKIVYSLLILCICIVLVISICVLYLFGPKDKTQYQIRGFSNRVMTSRECAYSQGRYFYVSNGKLYQIPQDYQDGIYVNTFNESFSDILQNPIIVYDNSVFSLNKNNLIQIRYDDAAIKKQVMALPKYEHVIDAQYQNITTDGKSMFLKGSVVTTDSGKNDFVLSQVDDNVFESKENLFDEQEKQKDIVIKEEGEYQYFYSGFINSRSIVGIADKENNIFYHYGDYAPMYMDDNTIILSGEYGTRILLYNRNDESISELQMPDDFYYSMDNVYIKDNCLYLLLHQEKQALSQYNGSQHQHKRDILAKYDVKNDNFSYLYQTTSKKERIIAMTDSYIYLLKNNTIYQLSLSTGDNTKFADIEDKLVNATFEVCNKRLFIWENNKMIFNISIM